ncbi:hypothetical protein Tco_0084292 [Tanacetum coccineum]
MGVDKEGLARIITKHAAIVVTMKVQKDEFKLGSLVTKFFVGYLICGGSYGCSEMILLSVACRRLHLKHLGVKSVGSASVGGDFSLVSVRLEIDTLHADTEDKELLISELQDSLAATENEIAILQIRETKNSETAKYETKKFRNSFSETSNTKTLSFESA